MLNEQIKISPYKKRLSTIIIDKKLAEELNISNKKRAFVSFGAKKAFVDVEFPLGGLSNEVFLSTDILTSLRIPEYLTYEIRIDKNEIKIGPCIGILISNNRYENIKKRYIKSFHSSVLDYKGILGAIIIFSLDRVDASNQIIEGYCYNPIKDNWEAGIFPYPLAIYKRIGISKKWENHFLSVIGDGLFNNYYPNKCEVYSWLKDEKIISSHIPDSAIYKSWNDIEYMLTKYKSIYVKPIWGMKGIGVVKISAADNDIIFNYRENSENKEKVVKNLKSASENFFAPNRYIIQQSIELINNKGSIVDLRCVLQKDGTQNWICNAIIARLGAHGSVVSNVSNGGEAKTAIDFFREDMLLSEKDAFILKEKIINYCMEICSLLDKYGLNLGVLGLDIGIDKEGKLWLIEINSRSPNPAIVLRANDILSYYNILSAPLYYGKSIAGFKA